MTTMTDDVLTRDTAGPCASGGVRSGVRVLQSAPEAEATFYSLPYIEALRACVRRWNSTAGGEHVHRSGSTAGGVAGQGTGAHVLTQDRIAIESHYEECYKVRHAVSAEEAPDGAVLSRAGVWPCPVHAAPSAPDAPASPLLPAESSARGAAGGSRSSRHESGTTPESLASSQNPRGSGSDGATRLSLPFTDAPEEVDLSTPAGAEWMRHTMGTSRLADAADHCGGPPGQQVATTDEAPADALRKLHAGLRRALGFPARDEGLLAVDDLLLGCRSELVASYPPPHPTSPHTASSRRSSRHLDATLGTSPRTSRLTEAEEDPATPTVVQRHIPDYAWRTAVLPVPPTAAERSPQLSVRRREPSADALRESALLEWFTDTLQFADRMSFSTVQTRCLLLNAVGLLETLFDLFQSQDARAGTPGDCGAASAEAAEDREVEAAITASLQDALSVQTCPVPLRVVERQVSEQPVPCEVPDPAVVGPLERRLATEKLNKKQQQQLRDQIARAPLITHIEVQRTVKEVEKDITVGPYFNLHETATILEHLTSSVAMHWRLWRLLLQCQQPQGVTAYGLAYEDAAPFSIPPLSEFCADTHYDHVLEHHALYVEACCTLEEAFETLFAGPLRDLEAEKQTALQAMLEAQRRDRRQNHANALTGEEFDRVERAFLARLNQKLDRHAVMATLAATAALPGSCAGDDEAALGEPGGDLSHAGALAATAPAGRSSLVPTPPPAARTSTAKSSKRAGSASHNKTQGALGVALQSSRVGADSVVLSADTVFAIDAVEARVDAAQRELNAKTEAASTSKKKGKP